MFNIKKHKVRFFEKEQESNITKAIEKVEDLMQQTY